MRKKPTLFYPVENKAPIAQYFWVKSSNIFKEDYYDWAYGIFAGHHPGVDFKLKEGTSVYNAFSGVVVRNEWHGGMGNIIGIRNGNIVAIYGHLKESKVNLGKEILAKQLIALSGNTGVATRKEFPHLHFEMRDIIKPTLAEMVFNPKFEKPIKNWKKEFTYKVNNANTQKTLSFLALRYFGNEKRWKEILKANPQIKVHNPFAIIPDCQIITIPNFS
ncbi:M23 family metallopeptidase [Candidatus Parcubacteria bacterium]|nr:M23 family metallopeptidase [Patescibacteria group bacterium]MBU4380604.1 M23 family metallopeptidase [Patescibacteria group bacterium]MCG2689532.1 M23 family metallopeptidase [Candidatus Parcubacteria bacterium]